MSIIDELRNYRIGTDLVSWHPQICEKAADYITDLLARAEAAEREKDTAIQYMRKKFGWCTGCTHFTGIYGAGCKIGAMDTCSEENSKYLFLMEK